MFLIVRGPAPSCGIAGYIPVRGRRAPTPFSSPVACTGAASSPASIWSRSRRTVASTRRSDGVRSRRLASPLDPTTRAGAEADLQRRRRRVDIRRDRADGARRSGAKTSKPRPTASLAGTAAGSPSGDENDDGASGLPDSGVLGAATEVADEQPFVAIAVLMIVGALLLTMLALVTRFLRGSWNP